MSKIINKINTEHEVKNALWRVSNNITNNSYIKRREVIFFEGTLQFLNTRDNIYVSQRKREIKQKKKQQIINQNLTNNEPINGSQSMNHSLYF